jgi:hypothetical protein
MKTMDEIAAAALNRDNLALRGLLMDMLVECPDVRRWLAPITTDKQAMAVAASIAELVARHRNQSAPTWTVNVPPTDGLFYMVKTAQYMRGIKKLCDEGSPVELRKRGFLAPPDFLKTA